MSLQVHRLPAELLTALARGGGGPAAVRHLAAVRRSRTLLAIRGMRDLAAATGHQDAALTSAAYQLLARVHRAAPAAAEMLLASPLIDAWAIGTAAALASRDGAGARPGMLSAVAAAAALHGRVPGTVALPLAGPGEPTVLPCAGTVTFPGTFPGATGAARAGEVTFRSHGLRAELACGGVAVRVPARLDSTGGGWHGAPRITVRHRGQELRVSLEGAGWLPLPGLPNPPTGPAASRWRARLAAGWRLLVRNHPAVAAEVGTGIRVITPLAGTPAVRHSMTFRDGFGCVAMTTPDDPCWVALTFAHEIQHAKLSVVTDVVRLTEPGDGAQYYAPWRDDPRPIAGLLHGTYAHLGVAGFWRRQRQLERGRERRFRAQVEYARWLAACRDAATTLRASGGLTRAGRRFVADLEHVLTGWEAGGALPARATAEARNLAEAHWARWAAAYDPAGSPPSAHASPA